MLLTGSAVAAAAGSILVSCGPEAPKSRPRIDSTVPGTTSPVSTHRYLATEVPRETTSSEFTTTEPPYTTAPFITTPYTTEPYTTEPYTTEPKKEDNQTIPPENTIIPPTTMEPKVEYNQGNYPEQLTPEVPKSSDMFDRVAASADAIGSGLQGNGQQTMSRQDL